MIELQVRRYFEPHKFEYRTVKEAIEFALGGLDNDLHFPEHIKSGDKFIWEYEKTGIDGLVRLKDALFNEPIRTH